jgi:Flp pilus assembly protein TadG
MIRRLRQLARDKRGSVVVEVALIAPVIATMVVGVVDLSNAFSAKLRCEQAAQRAIEKIMNTTDEDTVENTLTAEAASQANVPTDNVTVKYRLECNGTVTTGTECGTGQVSSQWIEVTVKDKYTPLFPVKLAAIDSDGTYHVSATAGMRIE